MNGNHPEVLLGNAFQKFDEQGIGDRYYADICLRAPIFGEGVHDEVYCYGVVGWSSGSVKGVKLCCSYTTSLSAVTVGIRLTNDGRLRLQSGDEETTQSPVRSPTPLVTCVLSGVESFVASEQVRNWRSEGAENPAKLLKNLSIPRNALTN